MNRPEQRSVSGHRRGPRERGDEPYIVTRYDAAANVVPANAGMNRRSLFTALVQVRGPRERGDEPNVRRRFARSAPWSPRTRG